jgi:hypothetical protein
MPDARLIDALAEENARLWRRVDADARRDDDMFLPGAVPVPGPWHFRRARAIVLVVQGNERRLRACLPRGVHLLSGSRGRYILAVTRFEDTGSLDDRDPSRFDYHEVTPFVPVWSGARRPAGFIPELYPDAWMATLLGREIHGFPKRTARVGFHDAGAELIVDRRLALRVRFAAKTPIPPADAVNGLVRAMSGSALLGRGAGALFDRFAAARPTIHVLVHKRIGACETAGRSFAIDDVVRVPITLDAIARAASLDALAVDLPGGPGVLHGEALAGFYLESGLAFDGGRRERSRGTM